jgi:hypothetical protein
MSAMIFRREINRPENFIIIIHSSLGEELLSRKLIVINKLFFGEKLPENSAYLTTLWERN